MMNLNSLRCVKDCGISLTKLQLLTACIVNFVDEVTSVPVGSKVEESSSQGPYLAHSISNAQVCENN